MYPCKIHIGGCICEDHYIGETKCNAEFNINVIALICLLLLKHPVTNGHKYCFSIINLLYLNTVLLNLHDYLFSYFCFNDLPLILIGCLLKV